MMMMRRRRRMMRRMKRKRRMIITPLVVAAAPVILSLQPKLIVTLQCIRVSLILVSALLVDNLSASIRTRIGPTVARRVATKTKTKE
jgi:hypothetical protein